MNFTETCRESSDIQCPLGNNVSATFDFTLTSENFCAEINIDIGLYGNIQIYSDQTFTKSQNAFIVGNRACLLVTLYSDLNNNKNVNNNNQNAAIFLNSTSLYSLTLRVQGTDNIIRLYSNGSLSSNNYSTSLTEIPRSEGNVAGFCFEFSSSIISNLNCTGVAQIVIGVEVMVNYMESSSYNTTGTVGAKREVSYIESSNSGQQSTTLSTTASVDTTKSQTNNNNNEGIAIIASIAFVLIALLF